MGLDTTILDFLMLSLKPTMHLAGGKPHPSQSLSLVFVFVILYLFLCFIFILAVIHKFKGLVSLYLKYSLLKPHMIL